MSISLILLCVFGILLLAADRLAQIRLDRPRGGRSGRARVLLTRRKVDAEPAARDGLQEAAPLGANLNAVPPMAQRT